MKKTYVNTSSREFTFDEEEVNQALSFYLYEKHDIYYGDEVEFVRRADDSIVVKTIDTREEKESK